MPAKKSASAEPEPAPAQPADGSSRPAPAAQPAARSAKAAKAPGRAEKITEPPVEPPVADEPEPAATDDEPLNRAERRARGKGKGQRSPPRAARSWAATVPRIRNGCGPTGAARLTRWHSEVMAPRARAGRFRRRSRT